jgi:hypothetical protein
MLVEALCYKLEGSGFGPQMRSLNFFKLPNPSSRAMAMVSTQLLTEMSTRNLSGRKVRAAGSQGRQPQRHL